MTEEGKPIDPDTSNTDGGNEPAEPAEPAVEPTIELVDNDFNFDTPEGFDVEAEADTLAGLKEFAVDSELPKKTAQSLFDKLLSLRESQNEVNERKRQEAIEAGKKEIKKDPYIGGAKYEETQKAADNILLKYGGADFHKSLVEHGMKNDPAFMRFIGHLNSVLSEDSVVTTSQSRETPNEGLTRVEEAEFLFGKNNKK